MVFYMGILFMFGNAAAELAQHPAGEAEVDPEDQQGTECVSQSHGVTWIADCVAH